jgi:hypothetical protein
MSMDDIIANLPNQIKLLPYYCDDCCCPEWASLSLALHFNFMEMVVLKLGRLGTKYAVEVLVPAYCLLLSDETLEFWRMKVRKQLMAFKPLVDAVKDDTTEIWPSGNAASSLPDFDQEGFPPGLRRRVRTLNDVIVIFIIVGAGRTAARSIVNNWQT